MLGNLPMKSKDYKSLMNFSIVGQSTSKDHILIIIYHLEVILFAQQSWGCELYLHINFKDWKCLEVAWRNQKIIGHFMKFHQLHKAITCSIFGVFGWFFLQNALWEIYFISSLKIKSKFWMEGHVWIENILGHFLPNLEIFLSVKISYGFWWFQMITTFSSS